MSVDDEQQWRARAVQADSIWHTPDLQRALMPALGATAHFLPDEHGTDGVVWQTFRRGPFRLGYVGFPLGGTLQGATVGSARIARLLATAPGRRLHVLRVVGSAFNPPEALPGPTEQLPESKIVDLPQFAPLNDGHIRRDVARARKSGVIITPANNIEQAEAIFRTYAQMVMRHGGALKYTHAYFIEIVRLSMQQPRLKVFVAQIADQFAGFLVSLHERDVGYYLHGAVVTEYRQQCVTDLLLLTALQEATAAGMQSFSLMASPPAQPNLVRFKEKWGGTTLPQTVHELRLSAPMAALMRIGGRVLQLRSRIRRNG